MLQLLYCLQSFRIFKTCHQNDQRLGAIGIHVGRWGKVNIIAWLGAKVTLRTKT